MGNLLPTEGFYLKISFFFSPFGQHLHVNVEFLMQLHVKRTFRCTSINALLLLNYINCLCRSFDRNHILHFFEQQTGAELDFAVIQDVPIKGLRVAQ